MIAFVFSDPPGVAPDEYHHFLKAVAAGEGNLVPSRLPPPFARHQELSRKTNKALKWMSQQTRIIAIPGRLSPEVFGCRGIPNRVLPCRPLPPEAKTVEKQTYVATYPPLAYMVSGIAMLAATSANQALYIGRLVIAALSASLIGAAAFTLWDRRKGWFSVAGLLAAVTPMVIFTSASLSSSGLEIASAICYFAAILRLSRGDGTSRTWLTAGLSAAILANTRELGPVWVVGGIAILVALVGRGAIGIFTQGGKAAKIFAIAAPLAIVTSLAWQFQIEPHPPLRIAAFLRDLIPDWGYLWAVAIEEIGVFGPLDTFLPSWVYPIWGLVLMSLGGLALFVGSARQRIVLIGISLTSLVATMGFDAVQRAVGFDAQGRHLLPFVVAIPLAAGEIINQRRERVPGSLVRALPFFLTGAVAAVHALAWYTIARRYAVGVHGPLIFLRRQAWAPPLGWIFWGLVAGTAAGLIGLFGVFRPESNATQ